MSVTFVNNTAETFTPTQSGAIATHIWECCRAAIRCGVNPLVVGMRSEVEPFGDIRSILIDYPWMPKHPLLIKILRAERKLTGWRQLRQRNFSKRIATVLRDSGAGTGTLILHNDPELAVLLRDIFPSAFIVHHFHNLLECKPKFRLRFRSAVDSISAVSDFASRWIENYYGCGPVLTIYNGVDSERFIPVMKSESDWPLINFTGRTGVEKAPDLLLRAACSLAQKTTAFRLQLLGSNHWQKFEWDEYQYMLKDISDQLGRKGVTVDRPGHIDRANLPGRLQKADIHVVPSRWDEPFGLVTAEGMACGLATVASRTGGTPELVADAGLLFERDSVEELAGHLHKLVINRDIRLEYGRKARARAKIFTWQRTWESFNRVIP